MAMFIAINGKQVEANIEVQNHGEGVFDAAVRLVVGDKSFDVLFQTGDYDEDFSFAHEGQASCHDEYRRLLAALDASVPTDEDGDETEALHVALNRLPGVDALCAEVEAAVAKAKAI